MGKSSPPLKGWVKNSYDETGRAVSGLSETGTKPQMPSPLKGARDDYEASGSADGGRMHKG